MSNVIRIQNVPDAVYERAVAKAETEGITVSELALRALEREVASPTVAEVVALARQLGPVPDAPPAADVIRAERDRR